jgi:hypothetical protein
MLRFRLISLSLLCAVVANAACEAAKSSNPLSPDVAGPIPGVSITAPKPLEPQQGGQVVKSGEPMTFLIENANSSGQRGLFLQIQVAADNNFQNVVHHADRIEPGANGRTSYRLPEELGSGYTYFWRLRAGDGANVGPYSNTSTFSVIDPVIIDTPMPLEPAGNLTTNRPTFRVRNGKISGTTDAYYRFELATAPDVNAIVAVVTTTPGSNGETTMTLGDLPYGRTFYWRVHASDGTTQSLYSPLIVFATPAPPAPAPSPVPVPGPPPPTTPGVPSIPSSGRRAPDPPPGGRLPLPDGYGTVVAVANQYPSFLFNSCQDHGGTWDFMNVLIDTLRQSDTRWGYNWKRGRVGDPSLDIADYNYGAGADEGTTNVYIIDVLGGHCGSSPSPSWNDVTAATINGGGIGRWTGRGRF